MRLIASFASLLLAGACVAAPEPLPVNVQISAPVALAADAGVSDLGVEGEAIALAFSGGGARAASFSHGVLLGLRDMRGTDGQRLIDRVALVTAVSGGAITAAWLGLHGPDDLDGFRAAALDKDWAGRLHTSALAPGNWMRLMRGGLNGPDRLADWLDREVFAGATMAQLRARPRIVINATELFTGAAFAFTPTYFDAICSDLGKLRVADAVGASMAVPVAFRPVLLQSWPEACPQPVAAWVAAAAIDRAAPVLVRETARAFQRYRDPARMRFLHLADGGVVDNFGLSSLITIRRAGNAPYAPFSARDAVGLSRLTFIVVNAELNIDPNWSLDARGPDGMQLVSAALDISINANKRMALEAFSGMLREWERALIDWRCALSPAEAEALGALAGWSCSALVMRLDVISFADLDAQAYARLNAAPTAVSLPADLIDALIAGGREAARINPLLRDLAHY